MRRLYPELLDYRNERENQKRKYGGELFETIGVARVVLIAGMPVFELYINFFQHDKNDLPKGNSSN